MWVCRNYGNSQSWQAVFQRPGLLQYTQPTAIRLVGLLCQRGRQRGAIPPRAPAAPHGGKRASSLSASRPDQSPAAGFGTEMKRRDKVLKLTQASNLRQAPTSHSARGTGCADAGWLPASCSAVMQFNSCGTCWHTSMRRQCERPSPVTGHQEAGQGSTRQDARSPGGARGTAGRRPRRTGPGPGRPPARRAAAAPRSAAGTGSWPSASGTLAGSAGMFANAEVTDILL